MPLVRLNCKWEDNIKKDFEEIGWEGLEWFYITQVREEC
jgi:hypothetical protein